jgi:DNA-binding NtrC family response regulator
MPEGSSAYSNGSDVVIRQATLLVADDDAAIRALIGFTLRPQYHVLEACNGLEVIGLMEIHPLPISLVISDIQMPNLGGLDVARWVRNRHPSVKLLLMSGDYDGDRMKTNQDVANIPFLAKPFKPTALALTVMSLLSD